MTITDIKGNILSCIGREYISAVLQALPDCEQSAGDFQESIIEVQGVGKVRFTCRRIRSKHNNSTHVFWNAIAAVKIEQDKGKPLLALRLLLMFSSYYFYSSAFPRRTQQFP